MINFLFGLTLGLVIGFVFGLWFYAKKVNKKIEVESVSRATINSIISGNEPKGEFIRVNKVEQALKENTGEVALGDIIEE